MPANAPDIQYRKDLPILMKFLKLPMVAVEVGVASGLFSKDLLDNGIEKLYSVDAWETLDQRGDGNMEQSWHDANYESTKKLLTQFGERSIILKGLSKDMADKVPDNSLGLAYFDGDHSCEGVMSDLRAWYPKVVSGGIIASHDYENTWDYGVKKAFEEFCREKKITKIYSMPENKLEDAGGYFIKP